MNQDKPSDILNGSTLESLYASSYDNSGMIQHVSAQFVSVNASRYQKYYYYFFLLGSIGVKGTEELSTISVLSGCLHFNFTAQWA